MPRLEKQLLIERCPHCSIHKPNLIEIVNFNTVNYRDLNKRNWKVYKCVNCGGAVLAGKSESSKLIDEMYPTPSVLSESIPEKPRNFLQQAIDSLHAPSGAIMLCASSVDAMLKVKGYREGTLYARIGEATNDHLLTPEMKQWADQVRLDANEQRHADEEIDLPAPEEAAQTIEFAKALAEFLFVLPSRVQRGIEESEPDHLTGNDIQTPQN